MMERLRTILRHSAFITTRRLVMVFVAFVLLERLAGALYLWEGDLLGYNPVWPHVHLVARIGLWGVPIIGLLLLLFYLFRFWQARRSLLMAAAEPEMDEAVQLELGLTIPPPTPPVQGRFRRWWDIWLLVLVAIICVPLTEWYVYRCECRSEFTVSCIGSHADTAGARAQWMSATAPAEQVRERMPTPAPYLHRFLLPDGDFNICCDKQGELLSVSHIRKTRRFTLRPHFAPSDEVELYISPVRTDAERKRVQKLLKYYMSNPQARRPYIRRMPFKRCQDSAVLYLDYGEYVLLPIPLGDKPTFAPALIYISLQP